MECFVCGVKSEKTMVFNAIMREGVVKICEGCSVRESIPIIRRVTDLQLKESEKNQTVYEKLSHMAGLDPKEHKAKFGERSQKLREQDKELRAVVNERKELSFPDLKQVKVNEKEDLVRNYHWAIFKSRRARRLTQAQLAEAISEPESSIKLIERGVLPDQYVPFIRKIQIYLGVTLFSKPLKKQLAFDDVNSKTLTLSDVKEIGEKVEEQKRGFSFFPFWRKKFSFQSKSEETEEVVEQEATSEVDLKMVEKELDAKKLKEFDDSNKLDKEDIDKIIFG